MKIILKYLLILTAAFGLAACTGTSVERADHFIVSVPDFTVDVNDASLKIVNGVYYYNGIPLSGYVVERYVTGALKEKAPFYEGLEEGAARVWYPNGQLEEERKFVRGEKDGIHLGWYENGNKRFEYNFRLGVTDGTSLEWYPTGEKLKEAVYKDGTEESVKAWRTNGKLYQNYVVKDGVIYGMNNSVLCYTLKNEKGEYTIPKKK